MVGVCQGLRGSTSIKILDLGANALGVEGTKALADGGAFVSSLTQARAAVCSPYYGLSWRASATRIRCAIAPSHSMVQT